ncbi:MULTISPECIES: RAMP superfamily CRISPR-associated protein [Pyrobaculum]|uniref:CRISPR-associated protein, Cmr6 family n=1 Tax=Pyrobaculum arsenaticum (strain DSM 13514 / JCM 11321 / PZ6) TaxID=340102 RepID=A4WJX5_PYRAR|nr:RAMP superfamily CRISPR-associated protein [Pyrobaculum arsenaticum]ABP50692.1 CRISPR-associated protein, Cmr6 family [Pyrobaculum arsenaticum DSM 13514]MCY0891128.1 CRISPR-associated protein Cmr6 [Pyrobaculum arsenaticum]
MIDCLAPGHNVASCVVRELVERSKRGPVELPHFSREVALGLRGFKVDVGLVERYLKELQAAMRALYPHVYRIDLELQTPLVVHVRNPYMPLEIGIAWHPYFNAPYIPATSIKGALRAGAGGALCGRAPAELFGEVGAAGEAAVTDAFPTTPDVLSADVITPHYKEPDFRETKASPTPLVFPVARPGATFAFLIGLEFPCDFAEVHRYVGDALREGLGAKTRVGYGIIKLK